MLPCVVLAGGLGTRMLPATATIPKALLPVAGRPFIDLQLELLARQGVEDVLYCVGHLGEKIRAHLDDGRDRGVRVALADEGGRRLGTAGALRRALDDGALPDEFLVLYGDSYLEIDLQALEAAWMEGERIALMTVLRNRGRWDRSNVVLEGPRVAVYEPDPTVTHVGMDWIDFGISVLSRGVILGCVPSGATAALSSVWAELARRGDLAALEVANRFYEVGSPAGLAELEVHLGYSSQPSQ